MFYSLEVYQALPDNFLSYIQYFTGYGRCHRVECIMAAFKCQVMNSYNLFGFIVNGKAYIVVIKVSFFIFTLAPTSDFSSIKYSLHLGTYFAPYSGW